MRVLFLITARGGSKGVPGKNIAKIGGLPLLAFKIRSAQRTHVDKRIICSTDSEQIAAVAREYGAEVPFMRPAELATDTARSLDVMLHAMRWLADSGDDGFDALMLCEPSAPFATYRHFDESIELYQQRHALSVIGMRRVEPNPIYVAELGDGGLMTKHYEQMRRAAEMRRQDFGTVYTPNGALYLVDYEHLARHHERYTARSYAYVMPEEYSIEIDNQTDLRYAEFLVNQGDINLGYWT